MHQPGPVRDREPLGDGVHQREELGLVDRRAQLLEVAGGQRHHQPAAPGVVVEDRHDVRVVEGGLGLDFAAQPPTGVLVDDARKRQLQRHPLAVAAALGGEHAGLPARAERSLLGHAVARAPVHHGAHVLESVKGRGVRRPR